VWAQREAVVKALGEGMLEHGREFSVEADPSRAPAVAGRDLALAHARVGSSSICVVAAIGADRSVEVVLRDW
jgi:hypothetical protein